MVLSGKEHQLCVKYAMVSPESRHTNAILWKQRVVFRSIYVYLRINKYMLGITNNDKEVIDLKEMGELHSRRFVGC